MAKASFAVDTTSFLSKALQWAQQFNSVCLFQSNGYSDPYSNIEALLAIDATDSFVADGQDTFQKIEHFRARYPQHWIPGFLSYDLKNEIEDLTTRFDSSLEFPEAYFFIPRIVILFRKNEVEIQGDTNLEYIFKDIQNEKLSQQNIPFHGKFQKRMSKSMYLEAFEQLKNHIRRGDIYEVNLCQEFYTENTKISPLSVYHSLNTVSPTPFSTFFKLNDKYILSASPERFLAKRGNTLISQPIKGTAARSQNTQEDNRIKSLLLNNPKEIAENVMIVDLVRNDLTYSAKPGTVAAERKLEIHTFKQVHQLVSTVTCRINDEISDVQAIRNTFPAGSMTGAPKISAMRLCDRYEYSKRGIYSGTVGYFSPEGDFDFNVVIRTLLYNATNQYLSFHTGGAITIDADAHQEYNECLVKAKGILEALKIEDFS